MERERLGRVPAKQARSFENSNSNNNSNAAINQSLSSLTLRHKVVVDS